MKTIKEMKLNEKITYFREKVGLSKSQLAREVEVSPAYITLIEKGVNTPSIPILYKIAYSLGIPASELSPKLKNEKTAFFITNADYINKIKELYNILFKLQCKQDIFLDGKDIDDIILATGLNSYRSAFSDSDIKTIVTALKISSLLENELYTISEVIETDPRLIDGDFICDIELLDLIESFIDKEYLPKNISFSLKFEVKEKEEE
ncbi:helix-turn-helix domain-containing protein [Clostridium perfringens]|uniref:helix-turn-helix domain-containing protein n=1 Tax=Clostridium perfringens TaxID=1502 RepID=UPI002247EB17|nr:helix-turn-helix transcriptional regulator [Clostridium perfringens]MCX0403447.1 helix-turn-helix domain-containing protein [Clostridium perfringens]